MCFEVCLGILGVLGGINSAEKKIWSVESGDTLVKLRDCKVY